MAVVSEMVNTADPARIASQSISKRLDGNESRTSSKSHTANRMCSEMTPNSPAPSVSVSSPNTNIDPNISNRCCTDRTSNWFLKVSTKVARRFEALKRRSISTNRSSDVDSSITLSNSAYRNRADLGPCSCAGRRMGFSHALVNPAETGAADLPGYTTDPNSKASGQGRRVDCCSRSRATGTAHLPHVRRNSQTRKKVLRILFRRCI